MTHKRYCASCGVDVVCRDDAELATHIIAQAKRRAERDEKMFDY